MRGVGWAICYQNPANGLLSNHWVSLHEIGNVSGFVPVLVMDVWEHAFLLDYKPAERPKYIEAFFSNIDWETVDGRVQLKEALLIGAGLKMQRITAGAHSFFTTKPQGSGMGLAISRSIIEAHDGRLWATANEGRGASFHFTLPVETVTPSPAD